MLDNRDEGNRKMYLSVDSLLEGFQIELYKYVVNDLISHIYIYM